MRGWKLFYLVLIISLLVVLMTSIYYTLGGFDPIEVFIVEGKERTVIGKEYVEKEDAETFNLRMKENRAAIDSGFLQGKFTVVFFEEDYLGEDSVHYFLGASVDKVNEVVRLPAGYDFKEFRTDKIFKVFLSQHWLAMPLPEEVKEAVEIKALEEGEVLSPFWFELYFEDNSLSVEYWAR